MSKAIVSSLYDSDVFRMACRQFDKAADAISKAGQEAQETATEMKKDE